MTDSDTTQPEFKTVSAGRTGLWITTTNNHVKYRSYQHNGNISSENWQTVSGITFMRAEWI